MTNYGQEPRADDVMLGSAHWAPAGALMLGGIEGLKQQFQHDNKAVRIQVLEKAIKYDYKGINLIIEGLKDPDSEVQKVAYFLLKNYQNNPPINQDHLKQINLALKQYIPYHLFGCLSTLKSGKKCVISNNGKNIAFFTGQKIRVFDLNTKELVYTINNLVGNRDFFILGYDPNLLIKVNNHQSHGVEIWQHNNLKYRLHHDTSEITAIALSEDDELLATATRDATIKIWRVKTGKSFLIFDSKLTWGTHKRMINYLKFSDDGNRLISSSQDGTIKIWDLKTGSKPRTLQYSGTNLVLSPDNLTLALADLYGNIQLIDLAKGNLIVYLRGHSQPVKTMIFSEYGRVLISGGSDRLLKFWSMTSKTEINSIEAHGKTITNLMFSQDYQYLFTVSEDNTVKKWGVVN